MNIPKEINPIGIIYPQRKKMSSKDCLLKHLKDKEFQKKIKSRNRTAGIRIVKAKDIK